MTNLRALVLVCTLKPSPAESSSSLLGTQLLGELERHGVTGEVVRVVDHHIKFGVSTDEGEGDEWPMLRQKMLSSDILVLASPIWLGQPSSVAKVVLERLDAELSETDEEGRMSTYGKVAAVAVVGNEDGAHHVAAEVQQALNEVGFTLPASAVTYWVGEALGSVDYQDVTPEPEQTASMTRTAAANTAHLARLLKDSAYPPA
ncbi:NAD(P)H-dependent oxidoreductase [Nocardioides sp. AN3]